MGSSLDLLAEELRRARVGAGMTQDDLAAKVSYSKPLVSAVETGRRRPSRDFVTSVDSVLALDGRLARILDVVQRDSALPWFREWLGIEQDATALRWFEPLIIPGLLQTAEYARAVLAAGGLLTNEQIDEQVATRLERQAVLTRDNPPQVVFVIDEQTLRRPVGGPEIMGDQLRHLLQVITDCPHVRIHVVPGIVGAYAGLSGGFVVAALRGGDSAAYLDNQLTGTVVEGSDGVAEVLRAWEAVRGEALPHQQSVALIRELAESWT
jgi:transcriptional regulator with XRE-family HTH domain